MVPSKAEEGHAGRWPRSQSHQVSHVVSPVIWSVEADSYLNLVPEETKGSTPLILQEDRELEEGVEGILHVHTH